MSSSSTPDAATLPDLTGLTVEHYEFMAVLGSGAFGTVYLARDTTTADRVAIKCMVQADEGTKAYEVQQDEIALHYAVHEHPNVVSCGEHFAYQGYLFLVMEYVEGGAVVDALEHGVFEDKPELAKQAIFEMFDAVEHLHKNGIYHRDIKPDNILCNEDGSHFRLADFGLATTSRTTKRAGGTASYMPPESFDHTRKYHCPQVGDKWAVSVLLVSLITGRYPWSSAKRDDRHYAAFLHDRDYHFETTLGLRAEVSDLLKRCFDEDASKRPTITEMRREIDAIQCFSVPRSVPRTVAPHSSSSDLAAQSIIEFDSSDWDDDSDSPEFTPPATPPRVMIQVTVHVEIEELKPGSSLSASCLRDDLACLSIKAADEPCEESTEPPTHLPVVQARA
ncbi:Serine/threonine protein kinase [Mycena chlorophos]|uniref:non-specific serine/threonine protein kinase n=1 Tax=Mycena chlorophos TaxID=658473 RepID=A0A8H6S1I0_MYCCL|nr:Serine/threonine protein kinase [Mycena chlorophos]